MRYTLRVLRSGLRTVTGAVATMVNVSPGPSCAGLLLSPALGGAGESSLETGLLGRIESYSHPVGTPAKCSRRPGSIPGGGTGSVVTGAGNSCRRAADRDYVAGNGHVRAISAHCLFGTYGGPRRDTGSLRNPAPPGGRSPKRSPPDLVGLLRQRSPSGAALP
jgi:hypothetical protein